jgi:hypothetical protein
MAWNQSLLARGAHVQPHEESSLALRTLIDRCRASGHTLIAARRVAGLLALRTSQAEKAYPSVPDAVAAVTVGPPAA